MSKPLSMASRHLSLKKMNWSTCTSSENVVTPGMAVDPAMAKFTPLVKLESSGFMNGLRWCVPRLSPGLKRQSKKLNQKKFPVIQKAKFCNASAASLKDQKARRHMHGAFFLRQRNNNIPPLHMAAQSCSCIRSQRRFAQRLVLKYELPTFCHKSKRSGHSP